MRERPLEGEAADASKLVLRQLGVFRLPIGDRGPLIEKGRDRQIAAEYLRGVPLASWSIPVRIWGPILLAFRAFYPPLELPSHN